jgi:hypothetical protein
MDEKVLQDYGALLLPRAVGYSAALLDQFFRGRLAGEVVNDAGDPAVVRFEGANASPDALVNGTLELYGDTPDGARARLTPSDTELRVSAAPGETVQSARFQATRNIERFVAVYRGALGGEAPGADPGRDPGAVIGRVLGGLRVEQVYREGAQWRIRTPRGSFVLPLPDDLDDVTWGDGDDHLVARTPLGPGQANAVILYEVRRQPGSVDLATAPDGVTLQLAERRRAHLPFSAPPLVTTIELQQTFEYRQQLGRYTQTAALLATPTPGFCTVDHIDIGALEVETVRAEAVPFAVTVPVILDEAHSLDLGDTPRPYTWQLVDVAADASGRLLGLAAVFLTAPEAAAVSVPVLGLDPSTGALTTAGQMPVRPFFPPAVGAAPIWALLDLATGQVLASTAAPTISVISREAVEAEPWAHPESPSPVAGIWRHVVEVGPSDCARGDLGWFPVPLQTPQPSTPIASRTDLAARDGVQALVVAGGVTGELGQALDDRGLLALQVGEAQSAAEFVYTCRSDSTCDAVQVTRHRGFVSASPVKLQDARRARPAPGRERLVFLALGDTGGVSRTGNVVVWTPGAGASVLQQFRRGVHALGAASAEAVLAHSQEFLPFAENGWVIPLSGAEAAVAFPGVSLLDAFTLLDAGALYRTDDLRFYRRRAPLEATPLPAELSGGPGNISGDFHAVHLGY